MCLPEFLSFFPPKFCPHLYSATTGSIITIQKPLDRKLLACNCALANMGTPRAYILFPTAGRRTLSSLLTVGAKGLFHQRPMLLLNIGQIFYKADIGFLPLGKNFAEGYCRWLRLSVCPSDRPSVGQSLSTR